MSIIPILKAREVLRLLLRAGFRVVAQRGSHIKLEHLFDKTRKVTVPYHAKDIKRGTLLSILRQARLSLSDFLKLLGK